MFSNRKSTKLLIKLIFGLILLSLSLVVNGYATEGKDFSELYKKARQEGKVVYYSSLPVKIMQELASKFEEYYPGIKVEIYRTGTAALLSKIMMEDRAGKHMFDVTQFDIVLFNQLVLKKLIGRYKLSSDNFYPKDFKDPNGYWITHLNLTPIAYNTKLVKRSELPLTWEGLLDPKWKGKLAMDNSRETWPSIILDIMGEEKGINFFKALASQKVSYRAGMTLMSQLMAAAEIPMIVYSHVPAIELLKKEGAPVDWVRMKSPIPASSTAIGIGEYPPHSYAARLFYEFYASKEGQEIIAKNNFMSARSDIETPLQREFKQLDIKPARPLNEADFKKVTEIIRRIFK